MVPPAQLPDDIIAQEQPTAESEKKSILPRLGLIAGAAVLAYLVFALLPYDVEARKGLALLTLIAILWLTEALHITITALLVPILAVIIGFKDVTTAKALSTFADPVIFLFFWWFCSGHCPARPETRSKNCPEPGFSGARPDGYCHFVHLPGHCRALHVDQ